MKTLKFSIVLIFILCINPKILSTAQSPDYLIFKGDTLPIFTNPLESYFDDQHPRPDSVFEKYGYNSTGCWRGYIGYWELKNDSLFLIELQGKSMNIDLSLIFSDRNTNGKIFADWFNYSILNPYGERILYVHMGYSSIFEFEKEFFFSKGILTDIIEYDNSKSIKSKYTQDQQLLSDFLYENTDHSLLPDTVDKAKVTCSIVRTTLDGKIDSVNIVRGYNETLDKEAIRVIKSIPEWDVIYYHGKPYFIKWYIPVIFERKKAKSTTR